MTFETLINGLEEALKLAKNKNEQIEILKDEVERLNGVVAELQEQINNKPYAVCIFRIRPTSYPVIIYCLY